MKTIKLGRTDIDIATWCLGSMTFGNQTPQTDARPKLKVSCCASFFARFMTA
uniref:hypothetical protein n=1 Tax=Yoonia sp. TaxID=2212373 RepID=UPI00404769C2